MRPGAKKKFDSRGSKSKSKMALTSGDAELAVRFLEESSEEENTEEQHMRVSYRQYAARKKKSAEWTSTEKQLIALLVVAFIIVVLLAVLLAVNLLVFQKPQTCEDASCVDISGSVLRLMNLSVDPCEDFYQFACGNFDRVNTIPPDKPKFSQFSVVADKNTADLKRLLDESGSTLNGVQTQVVTKAKDYYAACMNMSATDDRGIAPIMKIIKEVGSWTLTGGESGTWSETTWDLQQTVMAANRYGVDPFFVFVVGVDNKDSNMQLIQFDQGGLSFKRDHYLDERKQLYLDTFVEYFAEIVELLGGSKSDARTRAREIFLFETELAKVQMSKEERRNIEKIYSKMTVADVQDDLGDWIDLSAVLRNMFKEDIPTDEAVLSYTSSYFRQLQSIVENQPKELLADYIMWHVVDSYTSYLSSHFRDAALILTRALSGVDTLPQRWHTCVLRTENAFGYVTGAMFIEHYFPLEEKQAVEFILERIIQEFGYSLPTQTWMDQQTKDIAMDKLNAVKHKVAFPEISQNTTWLEQYYSKLEVTVDDQFDNALRVLDWITDRMIAERGKRPKKWEWDMAAEEVNAYYQAETNQMVFPAGILKSPFYSADFPMAMKFGALGMVIGHELSHGFDDQGRQFDKNGNLNKWWGETSLKNFKEKTQCMIDQYSQYTVEGLQLNGEYTLGENIADNGGVKTSYNAYLRWLREHHGRELRARLPGLGLSEHQLFFLGFSQCWCYFATPEYKKKLVAEDVHSPGDLRVRGVLGNMREFSDAYQCSATSAMNPKTKCEVW